MLLAAGRTHSRHRSDSRTPVSTAHEAATHGKRVGRCKPLGRDQRGCPFTYGTSLFGTLVLVPRREMSPFTFSGRFLSSLSREERA